MEALFTQALGLSPPWAVVSVDFRQSEGAIHFAVECRAKRLACPAAIKLAFCPPLAPFPWGKHSAAPANARAAGMRAGGDQPFSAS